MVNVWLIPNNCLINYRKPSPVQVTFKHEKREGSEVYGNTNREIYTANYKPTLAKFLFFLAPLWSYANKHLKVNTWHGAR